MPELPEVETIRQDLRPLVLGRTIAEAWIAPGAERIPQNLPPADFCRALSGRRIEELDRRGKYLLFRLSGGPVWIVHLRMTGSLQHHRCPCPREPHLRARFRLDDGSWLCYLDLRKLGTMWLVDDPSLIVGRLGPEPLDPGFRPEDLQAVLRGRSAPVKAVLMDQEALAGVGNVYADEALFAAGIHPRRLAASLSAEEVRRLHRSLRAVLVEAMGNRGSSFQDYLDGTGRQGQHQFYVKVYRRTGEPCYRCGSTIGRIRVGGRSAHFCPRCQA